jgi:hypothetical protein
MIPTASNAGYFGSMAEKGLLYCAFSVFCQCSESKVVREKKSLCNLITVMRFYFA